MFLKYLGAYAVPIVLVLAELLAALALWQGFWKLRWQKQKNRERQKGERIYQRLIQEGTAQAHMLVQVRDNYPLFVMDNLEKFAGVTREEFMECPTVLADALGQKKTGELKKRYDRWDHQSPFAWEFFNETLGKWIRIEIQPVEEGRYNLVSFEDISDEKEKSTKLEKRLELVQSESSSKTVFLSRMSHEIRTPMNGVIGMLMLARRNLTADNEVQGYLAKAEELSQYLVTLINDILDMSRIEAGKMVLAENVIDLEAVCRQLEDMFRKNIEAKGIHYVVEMLDFDVRYVIADELRLMQCIVNFLSNASKFTKEGEIRVTFRQMYRKGKKVHMMIRVHDTGKGMEPEFVNRIFKPFDQENDSMSRDYGGTGLGMTITDQIIQMMGGEIVIESMPGKGSDFSIYLELPIADGAQNVEHIVTAEPVKKEPFSWEKVHVLLAEDNDINAEITVSVLEMDGIKTRRAADGQQVVDMFRESRPGEYNVILMDIQMPKMNGFEAARAIRQMDRADAADVLIIALSADAFVEDRRKAMEAGMNEHMAKPIDYDQLKTWIQQMLTDKKDEVNER